MNPRLLPLRILRLSVGFGLAVGLTSCATTADAAPRQKTETKTGAKTAAKPATGGKAAASKDAAPTGAGKTESKDMTPKQWQAAEQTLRAHFTKHSKPLLEVSEEDRPTLGAVFWVRYKAGGGGLVLVRGNDVYAERGNATISAILKADQQLQSHAIDADDFLYLLQSLGELPKLPADPFSEFRIAALNPAWSFDKGEGRFVLHSPNSKKGAPGGAPPRDQIPVVRATLTVSADYSLRWTVEELIYSASGSSAGK